MQSGQVMVTVAGTAEQGPDENGILFAIKGHPANTGNIWVGNVDDDVSAGTGYPLGAGEVLLIRLTNLEQLWFDADIGGEIVCWIRAT